MLFANKVALVTGGGSGIGRSTALELAKEGASVVVGNRNVEHGESTVEAIRHAGGKAIFQRTDVTKPEEVEGLVKRAVKEFGRLDLAFNNAGVGGPIMPLVEVGNDQAKMVLDVNVLGVFYSMKYEIEQMLRQDTGGAIVNTTSVLGLKGRANMPMYVASKHAVSGLTKAAALENAKKGIRINAVAPGPIETPMLSELSGGEPESFGKLVPMGRIGQPIEVAQAVVWLLSDHASFVTGDILSVDGGRWPSDREIHPGFLPQSVASKWSALVGIYSNVILPRLCDRLIDKPHWAKCRKEEIATTYGDVLEIGVGTGLNLPHYPTQVRKITTVDPNPGMNKLLRRRINKLGIDIDQRVTSGEKLPFDDAVFDCVVTTMTLCSITDVKRAMSEFVRVLRSGGRYLFLEHGLSPDRRVWKWQDRLNWLQRIVGGGCRLDLDVRAVIASQPFASVEMENFYMDKTPKTHGYIYRGVAIK